MLNLLPTPAAGNFNDGERLDSQESRRERNLAKGINGNGQGTPLAIAVQQFPTPRATDGAKGGPNMRGSRGEREIPSAALALLKTPTAQLAVNGGSQAPEKRRAGGHGPTLADQVEHEMTGSLLPPESARDFRSGKSNLMDRNARPLSEVVEMTLLPTPRVQSGGAAGGTDSRDRPNGPNLATAVSLLPTPKAADGNGDGRSAASREGSSSLASAGAPTPNSTDWKGAGQPPGRMRDGRPRPASDADLPTAVQFLPTPTAMDSHGARNATAFRADPKPTTHADGWTLCDVFWTGDHTSSPSAAGNAPSEGPRHVQLSLGEPESG